LRETHENWRMDGGAGRGINDCNLRQEIRGLQNAAQPDVVFELRWGKLYVGTIGHVV